MSKSKEALIPWKNVRIRETTYARLVEMIESTEAAVEAGRLADPGLVVDPINPATRAMTFDQLINLLLDRRDNHKRRSRKSRASKKKGSDQG